MEVLDSNENKYQYNAIENENKSRSTKFHQYQREIFELNLLGKKNRLFYFNNILLIISIVISAFSVIILYEPNVQAGIKVSKLFNTENNNKITAFIQFLLILGSLSTNFVFNVYFCYYVLLISVIKISLIQWNTFKQFLSSLLLFLLKAFPVLLSTSQVVGLAAESNFNPLFIVFQVLVYGLMHWYSINHFVANWVLYFYNCVKNRNQYNLKNSINQNSNNGLSRSDYLKLLVSTKQRFLQCCQSKQRELNDLHSLVRMEHTYTLNEDLDNYIIQFQTKLVELTKNNNDTKTEIATSWKLLLLINIVNSVCLKFCYIGLDLTVWYRSTEFCNAVISNEQLCNNQGFIIPITLIALFPLNYLIVIIVGVANTSTVCNYINQRYCSGNNNEKSIESCSIQLAPTLISSIRIILFILTLLSFGTSIDLNGEYISNTSLLIAANINSIIFNSYFSVFPIPIVSIGFALLIIHINNILRSICCSNSNKSNELDNMSINIRIESYIDDLITLITHIHDVQFMKYSENMNLNTLLDSNFNPKQLNNVIHLVPNEPNDISSTSFSVM